MAHASQGKLPSQGWAAKPAPLSSSSKLPVPRLKTGTSAGAFEHRPDAVPGTTAKGVPSYAPAFEHRADTVGSPLQSASAWRYRPAFEHRSDAPPLLAQERSGRQTATAFEHRSDAPPSMLSPKRDEAFEHRPDAPGPVLGVQPSHQPAMALLYDPRFNTNGNQDVHWGPDGPPPPPHEEEVAPPPRSVTWYWRPQLLDRSLVAGFELSPAERDELAAIADRILDEGYLPSPTEVAGWEEAIDRADLASEAQNDGKIWIGGRTPNGHIFEGDGRRHFYESDPHMICNTSMPGCTVDAVWDGLLRFAAPGQTGPAFTGNEVDVVVPVGFFRNRLGTIVQFVDDANHTVTNWTEEDHDLHEGYVTRAVTVTEDGWIMIQTVGEGIGPKGELNELMAPPVFHGLDTQIQRYLLDNGMDRLW